MRRYHLPILLMAVMTFPFVACDDDDAQTEGKFVDLSSVSISDLTLQVGETNKIETTFTPENANVKQLSWTSSDTSIVDVANGGAIKAKKAGTVTISVQSVKYADKTSSCTVTVNPGTLVFAFSEKVADGTDEDGKPITKRVVDTVLTKTFNEKTELKMPFADAVSKDGFEFLGWGSETGVVFDKYKFEKPDILWAVFKKSTDIYVDLGLTSGALWSTENVTGKYAWAETAAKQEFTGKNYKFDTCVVETIDNNEVEKFLWSKYCSTESSAKDKKVDNKVELEKEDDVASVGTSWINKYGMDWITPDKAAFQELIDECYWVWTDNYNDTKTAGYIVYKAKDDADKGQIISSDGTASDQYSSTGDKEKKVEADTHIFLAAANYWTNSLQSDSEAYCLVLTKEKVGISNQPRYFGASIRPVLKK